MEKQKIQDALHVFDANLDTSIQLNSSKVGAQRGVFSLVVGAGGTGLDALLETKGLINKTCCLDEEHKSLPTDHVAYLAFDTDSGSLTKVSSAQTGGAMLDEHAGEFVKMESPGMAKFLAEANRSQVPDYIRSWLDFQIPPNGGGAGAGGVRQSGRLLLFHNVDRVRTAIRGAIRGMIADQTVDALNVYLMAGISGGTGSGTFLDLAYIVRNVAEEIAPNKVKMYGYLFLPDVNLSRPMPSGNVQYTKKNGFAALKELDYLMNMHKDKGKFVQRYSRDYVITSENPPFDFTHLICSMGSDGRVFQDPYHDGMRAVAQSVVSFVAEEHQEGVQAAFAITSHYDNIKAGTLNHPTSLQERQNPYIALGTYSYELPIDQILLYVTSLLFDKMDSMFDRDPTPDEVKKAYSALGLAPGSLLPELAGPPPKIAPDGVTWEDLFGKSPKYNLGAMCNNWIDRVTLDVENRAKGVVDGFADRFAKTAEGWFVDPNRGPIWLNHLIVMNSGNKVGLSARLAQDFTTAGSQITQVKTKIEQTRAQLQAAAQEAASAGALLGDRPGKTTRYIQLVNDYAALHAQLLALHYMQVVYDKSREIIIEQNNKFFDVIVEVLQGLKDVCRKNTDILVNTKMEDSGRTFNWQPLRIPDVSDVIKQAFDAHGEAADVIGKFCTELYKKAAEWSSGNMDVKTFIRDYLDANLGDIAKRTLEDYIKVILKGGDLKKSVITTLGPMVADRSVPMFQISSTGNDEKGDIFWLLSVPYSCPEILQGFKDYRATSTKLAESMTIQPSGINSRIFAQSALSALPLFAYAPLPDYELAYLSNPAGDHGKHLFMGPQENWTDLPSPIPYRSRPKMAGAYPAGVKSVEDELRALYKRCRDLPIIRRSDSNSMTHYELFIAAMPDLEAQFADRLLQDDRGHWDAARLQKAIAVIDGWLQNGLPDRALNDEIHNVSYTIVEANIPEPGMDDKREETAQECFVGEYNNIRRARAEVEKYERVLAKKAELELHYQEVAGMAEKANQIIYLLISGAVRLTRTDDGVVSYNYGSGERERQLVKVGKRMSWREALLADALDALAAAEEPMKRDLARKLVEQSGAAYKKMDVKKETQEKKKEKLEALLKGVRDRHERLSDDVMNGVADDGVTRETVAFYEKLIARLNREIRDVQELIDQAESGGDFDFEF